MAKEATAKKWIGPNPQEEHKQYRVNWFQGVWGLHCPSPSPSPCPCSSNTFLFHYFLHARNHFQWTPLTNTGIPYQAGWNGMEWDGTRIFLFYYARTFVSCFCDCKIALMKSFIYLFILLKNAKVRLIFFHGVYVYILFLINLNELNTGIFFDMCEVRFKIF